MVVSSNEVCREYGITDATYYNWKAKYGEMGQVTNVGCLAHARRKFMDAKKLQGKGKSSKADKALAKIQKLYGIESRLKDESAEKQKQNVNCMPNRYWMSCTSG